MTSLKESVKHAVPIPTPDTQWVSIGGVRANLEDWVEGYIKELEEHMDKIRAAYPVPDNAFDTAIVEVLAFLQGQTE